MAPDGKPRDYEEFVRAGIRNETIDELCDWLDSCIEAVEHNSEVYKACTAMVKAMRGKKTPDTATLGTEVASNGSVVTQYPTSDGVVVSDGSTVTHYPIHRHD
jgi:hypothetical protein